MIIDDLEALTAAATIEEVWSILLKTMGRFGFDRLIYGFAHFRATATISDASEALILSNLPQQYMKRFIDDGLYFNGPMVRWAADNVGAMSWQMLADQISAGTLPEAQARVVAVNHAYNVVAGYTIGFAHNVGRAKGALGLIARPGLSQTDADAIWARYGREIMLICNIAHLRLSTLPSASARNVLTKRQREVLEWVGQGKTSQDIAAIMGLTQTTVEKHLRLAREALQVDTTAQAILKAAIHKHIFLVEN